MPLKTKDQIIREINEEIVAASPQLQVDVDNGPFYYLAARGVAQPIVDTNQRVERLVQLATFNFPAVASGDEMQTATKSFGLPSPRGNFSRGMALFVTSRRPVGTEAFYVREGTVVSTANTGGVSFAAIETRALTAANADKFYNPSTRRYEMPVRVRALSAGTMGRIAPGSLRLIVSGASDFDGVTNVARFRYGGAPATPSATFVLMQQRFASGPAGLVTQALQTDPDNVLAAAMTTQANYPKLFYRLPDGPSADVWVLTSPIEETRTESIVALTTATTFTLSSAPALGLVSVEVNGVPVTASLELDNSLALGRSTRESSTVTVDTAIVVGDQIDITYTYDLLPEMIQQNIRGARTASVGDVFGLDVLVRYARTINVVYEVRGTVLNTFDPGSVALEVDAVARDYMLNGTSAAPLLGGVRSPGELEQVIRASVPGIDRLSIPRFGRKQFAGIVETIDIPPHSYVAIEVAADATTRFSG